MPMRRVILILVAPFAMGAQSAPNLQSALLLGQNAYRERKTDEAIKYFERAVEIANDSSVTHLWLARANVQAIPQANFLRQPIVARRALTQFNRAIELEPRNVDAHEDRAIYYMYAPAIGGGGMDKARAEAEVVRSLSPYRGALVRGEIEEHDKNIKVAESEYVALVASYPDSASPFNRLVGLYVAAGRYADAFRIIDARLAARHDDTWASYQLGRTAALSGERLEQGAAALRRYMRAANYQPGASEAHAHLRLGMILEKSGDVNAARTEYEAAIRLDPKLEDGRRALQHLSAK
jgi:tetratricopeptide (TPR) repeat protein